MNIRSNWKKRKFIHFISKTFYLKFWGHDFNRFYIFHTLFHNISFINIYFHAWLNYKCVHKTMTFLLCTFWMIINDVFHQICIKSNNALYFQLFDLFCQKHMSLKTFSCVKITTKSKIALRRKETLSYLKRYGIF